MWGAAPPGALSPDQPAAGGGAGARRTLAAFRVGAALAGGLPGPASRALAEVAGLVAADLPDRMAGVGMAGRRAMVRRHLRRVGVGPAAGGRREVEDVFASYARYWAESLRLPSLDAATVSAGMRLRDFGHVDAALDAGRGVILALPHLGGWEWAGRWLADTGRRVSVVVEALRPPEVFEWFVDFRSRLGMDVIPVGPGAAAASLAALGANRVLCLLCDRVVGDVPGIDVPFFGEVTRLPAGPVTLSLRTGAPVVPVAVYFGRRTDDHVVVVRPPLRLERRGRFRADVADGTARLAAALEPLIAAAPTQWHLLQPNWPSDLHAGVDVPSAPSGPQLPGS